MKICIVGAGAIGGYVGAKLALAGEDVTLIARGPHLAAIQQNGLKLVSNDGTEQTVTNVRATSDMSQTGPQDAVIVALKAHSLPGVAPAMRALYGPETMVVAAQNGIPWWYFRGTDGPYRDYCVKSVDPDGLIEQNIEVSRVIGCVVYPAANLPQPGVVQHLEGDRFSLGELDGSKSDRLKRLSQTMNRAGLKAPIRSNIRVELWIKLWGNLAFNPISALTRALLSDITAFPLTRDLARQIMTEAQAIANKLGIDFGISLEQRIEGAASVGAHKTSMLQDIESGRPTEIDAILGAVAELGRLTQTPTPNIDALYACVKLLEKSLKILRGSEMITLDIRELATELLSARSSGKAVESRPSSRDREFDLPTAYQVEGELAQLRRAEGHKTIGRKIGFTNRAAWPKLELDTIVWGYVFDDTVHYASGNHFTLPIGNMVAPRIEPEVVFKLKSEVNLTLAADAAKVLEAVEWMALGFEIVDCPYPNWRFRPADMVAAFGFHGALVIGDPHPLKNPDQLAEQLVNFKLKLLKNGETAAEGSGKNVYDSPALCLGQLARTITGQPGADPLVAGEVITSGTITDAQPVAIGEEWAAVTEGLNLPSLSIKFVS